MFPFRKPEGSVSAPVDPIKRGSDYGDDGYDILDSAANDLIVAVHMKDIKAVAEALRAAFDICESQPHNEGPL